MLGAVGVLIFVFGNAESAIHMFDTRPPFVSYDSLPSPNRISFEALDPRNQAVSSSYSIIERSGGSRGPSRLTYTKTEFEPDGQNTEHKPVGGSRKNRPVKPQFEDDSSSREYYFDNDSRNFESESTTRRPPARLRPKETRPRKVIKTTNAPTTTSSPKSINEIMEKVAPLDEASSAKSGKFLGGGGLGDAFEEGYDREKHFDKEGGKKFIEAHKKEGGEKAHQSYKKQEGYDKAEKENHGKEEKKAIVSEKEGQKKGHLDEEKHYGEQYKGQEGEKGISIKKKGGHQKGHKKSGFHKVHNKNEYKVDEEFFEKSHDGDEHEEHLNEHEKHAKEKGGAAKKNSLDSGYHEGHGEKKALQDKGIHHEEAAGHKKEAGEQEHHDEHSEYGKKGGVKEGGKYGHAEGGGSGGGYFDGGGF